MPITKSRSGRLQDAYARRQPSALEDGLTKLERMFCPPLDTALVAAIWNESRDLVQSTEVLKTLASEAEGELDKEMRENRDEYNRTSIVKIKEENRDVSGDIDELIYEKVENWNFDDSMKSGILQPHRPPPHSKPIDTALDFLLACFPTIDPAVLSSILAEAGDDLESAVNAALNQESDQAEVSSNSGGSSASSVLEDGGSSRSSISVGEAAEWGDDIGVDGFGRSKKAKKRERRQQRQRLVIWDNGGMLRHQRDTHEEENYPPPEENHWTKFDLAVERLTGLFPTVPRTTVASTLHKHHGKPEDAADELFTAAPPTSGQRTQTALDKKMDEELSRIVAVFPETSVDELRRVLVRCNAKGAGVQQAIEEVLKWHELEEGEAEHTTNSVSAVRTRTPVALVNGFLPDGVRLNSNTGEYVRLKTSSRPESTASPRKTAQKISAHTSMPVIPAYLAKPHDDGYEAMDPRQARELEQEYVSKRNELFRKAARAFQQTKNKGATGEAGIAFYYSNEGREMDALARQWGQRAAKGYVREASERARDDHLIDLHGLTVAEARGVVTESVNQWWARSGPIPKPLKIVTGVGKHSVGGTSRLHPAVVKLLKKDGWELDLRPKGAVHVTGVSKETKQ